MPRDKQQSARGDGGRRSPCLNGRAMRLYVHCIGCHHFWTFNFSAFTKEIKPIFSLNTQLVANVLHDVVVGL